MKEQNENKPRTATVYHIGKAPFTGDIVGEGTHGFQLRTGPNDSPASEWFAFTCTHGTCEENINAKG